ncbi:hypothetical protein [Hymenobacter fodinae]|uniref:Uncharacterized protein n=1 Tax=Hymenobacter fodinae TaxID=2510796 RepID=A0A4Z0NZZ3_9BACT|nr:hypothetical protein [Hymenobacter fodinae]TGE03726.1 hypothetical protein EU556_24245 [Hymenobacter fodinae]
MKIIFLLMLWWVSTDSAAGQVIQVKSVTTRTVPTTKQTHLDREMLRFLLFTHEADKAIDGHFQVPLLVSSKQPGIGVCKFGLNSAHAGYNVVFQYRHQLVFSSALSLAPLLAHLRRFLTQYPTAFTTQAQRAVESELRGIVEHNQTVGESELLSR